jgi:DNA-binding transcriptional LysR family regulator
MLKKIDWESQIGRRLKLRDLHVFQTVVQRGSMAKAAQQLGVSQPAVSEVMAELEHMLGVRLVDRSGRGVEPTIYGDALLKRSIAAFDELKQSINDIAFLSDPSAGEIRIGTSINSAAGLAAAVIDRLTRRHPRFVCHLITGETSMLYRALEERDVDAVLTRIAAPFDETRMQAAVLYTASRFVVAATGNSWSRRRRVGLADLVNEPWTLPPPDSLNGAVAADDFRAAGLDLPRATVITFTDIARVALVAKGRFLTIAHKSALELFGWNKAVKALPIELGTTTGPVGIITLKNRTLTPVVQLFIDCARELAKPLATRKPVSSRRGWVQEA